MEIAELILKYIDSLKYPAIIIGFGILFRKELSGILIGDFKAKYKDLELTVERSRKTLENVKKTQEIASTKITEILNEVPQNEKSQPAFEKINFLINSMKESLNDWENELIIVLRDNGGRIAEDSILHYFTGTVIAGGALSDRGNKLLKSAKTLLEKGLVSIDKNDLVLHPMFLEK